MNGQQFPPGWYRDPAGMHELRFFDGRWTERVADGGIETFDYRPLPPAAPAAAWPAAAAPAAAWPVAGSDAGNDVPRATRSRRRWLVVTGATGAVAVAATVVVMTHGGSDGSSFCADYARLAKVYASMQSNSDDPHLLGQADVLVHKLAGEAPQLARADLKTAAHGLDVALNTGDVGAEAQAAADRADVEAQRQCGVPAN